jgi:acylphosphatase
VSETAARLIVTGRVQGVGYRWWTIGQARRFGLRGWVRNRRDGAVEILAIGEPDALDRLESVCSHGPDGALPEQVTREPATPDTSRGFAQIATV